MARLSSSPLRVEEPPMKPRYLEHLLAPELSDVIEVCPRCRRGLVYYPTSEKGSAPWCYVCGGDEPGVKYRKMEPDART